MNTNDITKALQSASRIIKGETTPTISVRQVEDAMIALGDLRKRAGESSEAAFARLVRDNDNDMTTLAKAAEQLRINADNDVPALSKRVTPFVHEASEMLDEFVALRKRADESTPAAFARLSRENDPSFTKLWQHLRNAQDHA